MGAGISWWMGVKGRVCGKRRLTRVAVRGQAATRLELRDDKQKASGRARDRDDEDGTSGQGTRSKGQLQAGAPQLPGNDTAIGGGGPSEGMDE